MADIDIADVRELLTAIRDILTVPHPAYGHIDAKNQLIVDRANTLCGAITSFIGYHGPADLLREARILREAVAEPWPVTYPTRPDAQAEGIPARGTGEGPADAADGEQVEGQVAL